MPNATHAVCRQSKGQQLSLAMAAGGKTTIELVRYYTTKPTNGGIAFKCLVCGHAVNTLDFDHTKGNRRTQAAAAINQHAKESHASQLRMADHSHSRGGF